MNVQEAHLECLKLALNAGKPTEAHKLAKAWADFVLGANKAKKPAIGKV